MTSAKSFLFIAPLTILENSTVRLWDFGPISLEQEVTERTDSHKIGPSIAMVLFQNRRVIGHWATISAVTGWEQAR